VSSRGSGPAVQRREVKHLRQRRHVPQHAAQRQPVPRRVLLLLLLLLLQYGLYRWFSSHMRGVQRGPGEDLGGFAVV